MKDSASVTTIEGAREELAKWKRKMAKHAEAEARARSFARHYERQIQRLELPPEPGEGKVVRFSKRYAHTGPVYSFAAVKGGGRWWVTGDAPITRHGITWQALIDFVRQGNLLLRETPKPMVDEAEAAPPF